MYAYIVIIICSIWALLRRYLIDVSILGGSNIYTLMLSGVALKWSVIVAIIGLIFGISGIISSYKKVVEKDNKLGFTLMWFYIIVSFMLLL